MSSENVDLIINRLNKLRVLDGILDFSKASTQLDILIALSDNRPITLDELVSKVGRGKRQVMDAIRKMIQKGFVRYEEKDNETLITIDKNGIDYLEGISSILSVSIKEFTTALGLRKMEITENIGAYFYVYQALIVLGVKQRPMNLNKLASVIGLSPNRLESYLDMFTSQDVQHKNIFEKIYMVPRNRFLIIGRAPKTVPYYKLSDVGAKIFYRIPFYLRFKNSISMRFLMRFMFVPHYETALKRFIKFYIFGTIVILFMFLIPYGWLAIAAWLFFSIIMFFIILLEI